MWKIFRRWAKPSIKLHSRRLSDSEWEATVAGVSEFFRSHFPQPLIGAEYGFGCDIEGDLTYVRMRLTARRLESFLRDSIAKQIFLPGKSDLHVYAPEKRLMITFCHEGDIHVSGVDEALVQQFVRTEPFTQFDITNRRTVKASDSTASI